MGPAAGRLEPPDFELRQAFLLGELGAARTALDLGCGQGDFTAVLAAAGVEVVGAEVAARRAAPGPRSPPELRFELVPIEGPLPFADGAFDLVWAAR